MQTLDYAVLTGRFAPFLNSHLAAARGLLDAADRLIVILTAAEAPRQARFPWTADEREAMIRAALPVETSRVTFLHTDDHPYRDIAADDDLEARIDEVMRHDGQVPEAMEVHIETCHTRDDEEAVCAALFAGDEAVVAAAVPPEVLAVLVTFRATPEGHRLSDEAAYVAHYKETWASAPWPPMFITVDTCITCDGHVLLIQRGGQPGRGLWALPGGFLDRHETTLASAIRELREETGLHLGDDEARRALRRRKVFDAPFRSAIGRVVTHGFHFELSGNLPEVTGSDDARAARWWPVGELAGLRNHFHDDHGHILDWFLGGPDHDEG